MLFLINQAMVELDLATAGLTAVLGYAVVFFGLILLMLVVSILGKVMSGKARAAKQPAAAAAAAAEPAPQGKPAPGTAGELKLHDVDERDAALLMAIVAHKTGKPLNELRFKSIKEVKGE